MTAYLIDVDLGMLHRLPGYGHQPLLITFPDDPQEAYIKVQIAEREIDEFRDPQPGAVQYFQHGAVAGTFGLAHVDGAEHLLNLLKAEGVR